MTNHYVTRALGILTCAILGTSGSAQQQTAGAAKLYNTAKQKLLEGKQVFSFTQSRFDVAGVLKG
jgi:hypothetical protein